MEIIIYSIKVNIAFAICLAVYWLFMRRETSFGARRIWLLASCAFSILLPLIGLPVAGQQFATFTLPEAVMSAAETTYRSGPSLTNIFIGLHIGITLILLIRLGAGVLSTIHTIRKGTGEARSFFSLMHIPEGMTPEDEKAIRCHEEVHVRRSHSADVLLYSVVSAIWWSVPLWWIAFRELRLVHEYEADLGTRDLHPHYEDLLLSKALSTSSSVLTNSFHSSNLKQRIIMLYNDRSPRHAYRKAFLFIPTLVIALALISWDAVPVRISSTATEQGTTDKKPEFPGGTKALFQYINENMRYPELAAKAGIEGTVYVEFVVKADGSITDAKVKRGVHPALDAEALRVIGKMPKWEPASKNGKAINAEMIQPLTFQLAER